MAPLGSFPLAVQPVAALTPAAWPPAAAAAAVAAAMAVPVLAMLAALVIDRRFGEPPLRWHPVVWIGHYLTLAGGRLPALPPRAALVAGTLAWWLGALVAVAAAALAEAVLRRWLQPHGIAGVLATGLLLGVLLKPMLSWRMLRDEVASVEAALGEGLQAGRERVARLCSRRTDALGEAEVRETAIETLAENLNDSVVAPLLWFALAGLPGAVLFRYANTADAMWGYRGRWEHAGRFAARADDVLAWLPARITARALLPARIGWRVLAPQARRTPSPNGGWPMAAMALALGIRLRKPGVYVLNAAAPEPGAGDVPRALRRAGRALVVGSVLLLAVAAGVGLLRARLASPPVPSLHPLPSLGAMVQAPAAAEPCHATGYSA